MKEVYKKSKNYLEIVTSFLKTSKGNIIEREYMRKSNGENESVSILLKSVNEDKWIFVKQHRAALSEEYEDCKLIECIAGSMSPNDDPIEKAIQEIEEETGYLVDKNSIKHLDTLYSSPGCTCEKTHFFFAETFDKISKGGGLEDEGEEIEIIKYNDLNNVISLDLKTSFLINLYKQEL